MKTKIVATIGPTSDSEAKIKQLIKAGASCFRFNLKHSELSWHKERIERVRKVARELKTPIALFIDLQGPEVRIGVVPDDKIFLKKGETVALASEKIGEYKTIPLASKSILKQLASGQTVFLDDAFLELRITKKLKNYSLAKVILGGPLGSRKGANFPDLNLDLPTLVKKDLEALTLAQQTDIDFVALSFVRRVEDIRALRAELKKRKINPGVIAKIETKQAIKNFEEIVEEADAIMVARGDLGVEFAFEKVPFIQKEIVTACRMKGKPVIVATQMLQSMIEKPRPTRAEISDVANAVYEGTDGLMLSGETANGKFPVGCLQTMAKIAQFIEDKRQKEIFEFEAGEMDEVIAQAGFEMSKSEYACGEVDKIVVLTETGRMARLIASFRPDLEIVAVSRSKKTVDQLMISYGVKPFHYQLPQGKVHSVRGVVEFLKKRKVLRKGEKIILTHGEEWGAPGKTNTLRILEIE